MEEKKKWTTLRNIAPPQPESVVEDEVSVPEIEEEEPAGPPKILVVHELASTYRLVRETLENFTDGEVETTPDPLHAFELALQKNYQLFVFALKIQDMEGPLLYELISKAYTFGREKRKLAPGVIYIREKEDPRPPAELSRDARVKDIIVKPVSIDRLLKSVEGILDLKDPMTG